MTKEEYQALIDFAIKLRTTESILAEMLEELREANAILREMLLTKGPKRVNNGSN